MLNVLLSGKVIRPPKSGKSVKGTDWTTVIVRCPVQISRENDEPYILANVIAFDVAAGKLARVALGDAVSMTGDARLNHWTGQDGQTNTGLAVTAHEVLTAYGLKKKRETAQNNQPGISPRMNLKQEHDFDDPIDF